MRESVIRLRKLTNEAEDGFAPNTRDKLLNAFVDELEAVISPTVINAFDDTKLRHAFCQWFQAASDGFSKEDRHRWLAGGVIFSLIGISPVAQPPQQANVSSLFR
ncbi:hypothetical protein D9M68_600880 [compost metagenome]